MVKKIIITLVIAYGLFQLLDVKYKVGHEGVGLLGSAQPHVVEDKTQSFTANYSSISSVAAEAHPHPCGKAGFVLNPTFTSGIKARLPEFLLSNIAPKRDSVSYFSELIGVKTPAVEFRWLNNGAEFYRETVAVKGLRWRVWSSVMGLANADVHIDKSAPLVVEVWSNQCLIHRGQIAFSENENLIHLDQAASYFDYYDTVLGDASDAYQYSKESKANSLVYRFDTQRSAPRIYIDTESQARSESTRDVFSLYVMRNESLPLPLENGKGVMNYSDVNINRKTTAGDTVLLEAIKNNSLNTIKSLLAIGANPFIRDAENHSPLDLAIGAKDRVLIDLLVEHMLWGHAVGRENWSHTSFAEILSAQNYRFLKQRNRLGETALMRAAASGDEFALIGLIGMNSTSRRSGELPYLDPYHFDYEGKQAVDIAQEAGYKGAVLLLEKAMEQFAPAWANYRMLIASELEGDKPTKCFIQPGKRIWLLSTLVDMPIKKVKLVWSVSNEFSGERRSLKTEEFFTTSTEYQLKSFIDPIDIGGISKFIHADLYLNDKPIRNASITKNYVHDGEVKCDYYDSYPKSSLKQQFAAWVPLSIISKRAETFDADNMRVHQKLLEEAVAYESPSLLGYLLNKGMKPTVKYYDKPLVGQAIFDKKLALTQHLLAEGADLVVVDAAVRKGKQSLMTRAVRNNDVSMVRFLAEQGLPVNEADSRVAQPLVDALDICDAAMVEVLLQLGANPFVSAGEAENETIWEYAEKCAYEPKVRAALSLAQNNK